MQQSSPYHVHSVVPPFMLSSEYQVRYKTGSKDYLCNHLQTQVELAYVEQVMNTLVWKNSII